MEHAHEKAASETVDAPDYLADAERYFRSDPFVAASGIQMSEATFADLIERGELDHVRSILIAGLSVPSYAQKAAAFALGQLGDPRAMPALEESRAEGPPMGQLEALNAALLTLREMPRDAGSTDGERRKAVENAYHGRPLRSQAESPTSHLRQPRQTEDTEAAKIERRESTGFWRRLFGG